MKIVLISAVFAHMHLQNPPPLYLDQFNANAPANLGCTIFPPNTGALAQKVQDFNAAQGNRPLRDFVDQCYAQTNSGSKCGKTDPNHVVNVKDGKVSISIGADHVGPSAIYLDDLVLHTNTGIERNTVREHDFGSKLSCGKQQGCLLRFVQVALHVSTPEIYDNCVRIGMNSAEPDVQVNSQENEPKKPATPPVVEPQVNVPVADKPIEPILSPTVQVTAASIPTQVDSLNSDAWACEATNLVRTVTVAGRVSKYTIPCAPGTTCKIKSDFAFCDFNQ